jgi:hypothetical protein
VLAAAGFLVILGGSIVGCFAYYPPPDETIAELNIARTEALGAALSGDKSHALHWIPICENWTRRLQVGLFLRRGELSDYHRMKARIFHDRLELLEHMLEDGAQQPDIRRQVNAASRAFSRLSHAFLKE